MATHAEEILNIKTTFGEEILPVPEIATRKGVERRTTDATPEMFMETFAPRGIEFGNWNNQEERQQVMNHAYDGLLDLADAMNLPPKALMLNGELAIAFGARGQGLTGAKAHYERDYGVINLTKMKGAGSLGHEFMHALDHYLGRQDTKAKSEKVTNARGDVVYPAASVPSKDYASHGFSYQSGVREDLRKAFTTLIESMYKKAEQYVEDTKKADEFLSKAREHLKETLDGIRTGLAQDMTNYHKSKGGYSRKPIKYLEPASAEHLAEFDRIADILLEGGDLDLKWTHSEKGKGRYSNDTVDLLNKIFKAVRNRSGFATGQYAGPLDKVAAAMRTYKERLRMFDDAQNKTEKTKKVPTSYAIEAKKMDQARSGDYWSEPHEMIARAFAAYVEDKITETGGQSDFLVYQAHGGILLPMIDGFVARPYPEGKEREAINKAFDTFIKEIKTRETPKGVEMYSTEKSPIATLTGKEISGPDYIKAARDYYKQNLQGKTLHREEIGDIRVTGKGWEKARRGVKTDELKAKLFPAIRDVIEKGQYHGREAVTGRKDDIVAFHYFDGRVDVGGNVVQAGATVAEDSRGNLFYNINHDADALWAKRKARLLPELEARGGEPFTEGRHEPGLEARGGEPSPKGSPFVKYSLSEDAEGVNIIILSEPTAKQAGWSISDVKKIFKGQEVVQTSPNGPIFIKTSGGKFITVETVDHISPNEVNFRMAYGRQIDEENETITGAYGEGNIRLVRGKAGKWTLHHESVHALIDAGIISEADYKLLSHRARLLIKFGKMKGANKEQIGGEEDVANLIADIRAGEREVGTAIGRIVQKILDFIDSIMEAFGKRTAGGVVRDLETGEIFGRELTGKGERGTNYAVTPKKGTADNIPAQEKPLAEAGNWKDRVDSDSKDGWYVTGRAGTNDLLSEFKKHEIFVSDNADVAEYYAGYKGSIWQIKPKEDANILDATDSNQIGEVVDRLQEQYDTDSLGNYSNLRNSITDEIDIYGKEKAWERIKESLQPKDIIEDEGFYSDTDFVN